MFPVVSPSTFTLSKFQPRPLFGGVKPQQFLLDMPTDATDRPVDRIELRHSALPDPLSFTVRKCSTEDEESGQTWGSRYRFEQPGSHDLSFEPFRRGVELDLLNAYDPAIEDMLDWYEGGFFEAEENRPSLFAWTELKMKGYQGKDREIMGLMALQQVLEKFEREAGQGMSQAFMMVIRNKSDYELAKSLGCQPVDDPMAQELVNELERAQDNAELDGDVPLLMTLPVDRLKQRLAHEPEIQLTTKDPLADTVRPQHRNRPGYHPLSRQESCTVSKDGSVRPLDAGKAGAKHELSLTALQPGVFRLQLPSNPADLDFKWNGKEIRETGRLFLSKGDEFRVGNNIFAVDTAGLQLISQDAESYEFFFPTGMKDMVLAQGANPDCYAVNALGLLASRIGGRRRLASAMQLLKNGQVKVTFPRFPNQPILLGQPNLNPKKSWTWKSGVTQPHGLQGPLGMQILERAILDFLKERGVKHDGGWSGDVLWLFGYEHGPKHSLENFKTIKGRAENSEKLRGLLKTWYRMSLKPEQYILGASRNEQETNLFPQFPDQHAYAMQMNPDLDQITLIDPHNIRHKQYPLDLDSFLEVVDRTWAMEDPDYV